MCDAYYLDLMSFTLEKFKILLLSEEMIPSRRILLEDTDECFNILHEMGVYSLQDLISTLGCKQKRENFSHRSGLSLNYLTILWREAKSYHPKVVYFREIPGLKDADIDVLARIGITHSRHLFRRAQTENQRAQLSDITGIPTARLLEMVRLSDLARVRGLGPAFVRLFYEIGVDSIVSLARSDPGQLFKKAHALNQTGKFTKVIPPLKDFEQYIRMAQDLPKEIEYP